MDSYVVVVIPCRVYIDHMHVLCRVDGTCCVSFCVKADVPYN